MFSKRNRKHALRVSKGQLSDRQFRDINTLLSLLFTTKFFRSGMPQLKTTRIYLSKFPTAMERFECFVFSVICLITSSDDITSIHVEIILFSIYTLSDLGVLSNLIGSLSLANEHYSPPTE